MISFNKARVIYPEGVASPARFVFKDGVAAVWKEDSRDQASRVLFAVNASYVKTETGRTPNKVVTGSGEWTVRQLYGGCGSCGARSLLSQLTVEQLLDPDTDSYSR